MIDPFAPVSFGRHGLEVPRFGLGCAPLGGIEHVAEATALVEQVWQRGIRFFVKKSFSQVAWGGAASSCLGLVPGTFRFILAFESEDLLFRNVVQAFNQVYLGRSLFRRLRGRCGASAA